MNNDLISPRRCGKVLRVDGRSFSMLAPGDYPCTLPEGHEPATRHAAVMVWGEVQFNERGR